MEDTKTNRTLVNVILDRSGSMESTRLETISGYNNYLKGLRSDTNTEYDITLIQFDAHQGPELTVKYTDKPLAEVPDLTEADYLPRGYTPLYDAVGECIRRVETKGRLVINVIITDGQENASKEFTRETIKALITEKEKKENWTFVFLGADIDSYAIGGSLGMAAGNTSNYKKGMESNLYASLADSTMLRSAHARTKGVKFASMTAMFDDSQRASMGDATVNPKPTPSTTGGRPAVPPTFPGTPNHVPNRTRRQWRDSN